MKIRRKKNKYGQLTKARVRQIFCKKFTLVLVVVSSIAIIVEHGINDK